jgi:hypothetical protein
MPTQTIFRVLAIGITAFLYNMMPSEDAFKALLASLAMAHFSLSYVYAKRQFTQLFMAPVPLIPIAVVVGLAAGLFAYGFSLVFYFWIHHIFNETYLMGRNSPTGDRTEERLFRASTLVVHSFAYFAVLNHTNVLKDIDPAYFYWGFAFSYILFLYSLYKVKSTIPRASFIDNCAFELFLPLLVVFSLYREISFYSVICYHVVFWCFIPLPNLLKAGADKARNYIVLNIGLTVLFIALSPIGFVNYPLKGSFFFSQFILWSFLHISTSFALSRSQPAWITRWFAGRSLTA